MPLKKTHLSPEAFFHQLALRPGLIPVSIDSVNHTIKWMDVEKYHFYEGFFHKSIQMFLALKKNDVFTCITPIDILQVDSIFTDYIAPKAFIFHAGRSGSTLLAKVIARSTENLILSEADPLNNIWPIFTNNGKSDFYTESNKAIYRNLVLAMARRRTVSQQNMVIKFTSYNIRFFDFIHAVFPDAHAVFLTREIDNILISWKDKNPGWLLMKDKKLMETLIGYNAPDLSIIVEGFITEANKHPPEILQRISYTDLIPENLIFILESLNLKNNIKNIELMKAQFLYDSKKDYKQDYKKSTPKP